MLPPLRTATAHRLLTVVLACSTLAALLLTGAAHGRGGSPCPGSGSAPRQTTVKEMRKSLLCLVNRARARHSTKALAEPRSLRRSATAHSRDMVRRGYFSHVAPSGRGVGSRVASSGYLRHASSYSVGENIGGGAGRRMGSPKAVFRAWLNSPSHRANLLSRRFEEVGVGVARGFPGRHRGNAATYTLDFGTRR